MIAACKIQAPARALGGMLTFSRSVSAAVTSNTPKLAHPPPQLGAGSGRANARLARAAARKLSLRRGMWGLYPHHTAILASRVVENNFMEERGFRVFFPSPNTQESVLHASPRQS